MQIQKEDIRKTILKVAREEFVEKGYKGASMRTIAQKANVGLSNIYNYFKNKDEIFKEILSPIIHILDEILTKHNEEDNLTLDVFKSRRYEVEFTMLYVNLLTKYSDELTMLFLKANGSEMENFAEQHIQRHTQVELEYLRLMKQKFPELENGVSEIFMHTMCARMISVIREMLMHKLSHSEIERFMLEYVEFAMGGWKCLMKVKDY